MTEFRNILLTFDYELFLGEKSGSVDKCVIEPTQQILGVLEPYNVSAIFFVDMAWLVRLKAIAQNNEAAKNDYKKVLIQLHQILKSGHYIFNHLHPHWLDAKYLPEENQWDLSDQTHYRFSSLTAAQREKLFTETSLLLKDIIEPVKPSYKADAYRAGGWSIQPFTDFIPYFNRYGIQYDFSVMPGMKSVTNAQQYDFNGVTTHEPYNFSTDPVIPGGKGFIEYPISSQPINSLTNYANRALLKYLHLSGNKSYGDGYSASSVSLEKVHNTSEMLSIELLTSIKLPSYIVFLKKQRYIQFISHPKMLSAHNISTFARFMKKASLEFNIVSDFKKMLPQ